MSTDARKNLLEAALAFASETAASDKEAITKLARHNDALATRYMLASRLLNHTRYTDDQIRELENTIDEFDSLRGIRW